MKTSKSFFFLFFIIPYSLLLSDIIYVPADTSTIQGGIFLAGEGDNGSLNTDFDCGSVV
jgi:hypothetical protein